MQVFDVPTKTIIVGDMPWVIQRKEAGSAALAQAGATFALPVDQVANGARGFPPVTCVVAQAVIEVGVVRT